MRIHTSMIVGIPLLWNHEDAASGWDAFFLLTPIDIDAPEEETPPIGGNEPRTMLQTPYHRTRYPTDEDDDPG